LFAYAPALQVDICTGAIFQLDPFCIREANKGCRVCHDLIDDDIELPRGCLGLRNDKEKKSRRKEEDFFYNGLAVLKVQCCQGSRGIRFGAPK
jgi:hypothetical protein